MVVREASRRLVGRRRCLAALLLGLTLTGAGCGLRPAPAGGSAPKESAAPMTPSPSPPASSEDAPMHPVDAAPLDPKQNHPSEKVSAKRSTLALHHLRLKPGARLVRTYGIRKQANDVLLLGDRQAALQSAHRGYFFEAVSTAEAACELFLLAYPGAVVVRDEAALARVRQAVEAKGWTKETMPVPSPAWFGIAADARPGGGFRVRALLIRHSAYGDLGLREVVAVDGVVMPDGRVGARETVCVKAPESPHGVPPTWKQPLPLGPADYNRVLRAATAGASEVADPVTVTEERLSVPCPAEVPARWFQNDYERWPQR